MRKIQTVVKAVKIILCTCAVLGWWGVLYPELILTADTYRICDDSGQETSDSGNFSENQDVYWDILKTDRSEIRFRSRLFMEWNKVMEALHESDEYGVAP